MTLGRKRNAARFLLLMAALFFVAAAFPAYADGTAAPVVVDLANTAQTVIELLVTALGAVALALLHRTSRAAVNMHMLQSDKQANDALDAGLAQVCAWGVRQLDAIVEPRARIEAHSVVAAQAAELLKDLVPQAVASAGIDDSTIQTRIRLALGDPTLGTPAAPQAGSIAPAASAAKVVTPISVSADSGSTDLVAARASGTMVAILVALASFGLLTACTEEAAQNAAACVQQAGPQVVQDATDSTLTDTQKGVAAGLAVAETPACLQAGANAAADAAHAIKQGSTAAGQAVTAPDAAAAGQ